MKAFHDIRSKMRESCAEISRPALDDAPAARIARIARQAVEDEGESAIEPWMEAAFEELTHGSETGAPFALVSCFMNGEPAAVIALARPVGRKVHIMPLFLACQPWMNFSGQAGESGDEGSPRDAAAEDAPAPG